MEYKTTSAGLSYKKLDLHVHTPASKNCFSGTCTPEDIVRTALEADLDGIAVTDHNSADWVDRVKEAADDTPLVVFPGVEITCPGGKRNVHIIALFDPKKCSRDIENILTLVGITEYGSEDAVADKTPTDVMKIIDKNDGLAVLAHANSSNGVLADMTGQQRIQIVQSAFLSAIEATDFDDTDKINKGRRVIDFLNGKDPSYKRKIAVYQASDNLDPSGSGKHFLAGIGSRYSYFKMERIDLDALYQCFADPEVRIRQIGEKFISSYPQIRRAEFDSGFFTGEEIIFHPGLNSILGAKGAGKSLLIEFLRFALGQEPNNKSIYEDHLSKLRSRLGEFGTAKVTFVDENGQETTIPRTFRELDGSPYKDSVSYDPAQIFPVLFLSQNEIIAIAENESEQLQFIDRFFDFHPFREKISSIEKELLRLDKTMADGLRAYTEYLELENKARTMDADITKLDVALKNSIFEKFKGLESKDKTLSTQQEHFQEYIGNINRVTEELRGVAIPPTPEQLKKDPAVKRNLTVIMKAHEAAEETLVTLERELKSDSVKVDQEYQSWLSLFNSGKDEYEQYIQNMGGDYKSLALQRERLVRQRTELQRQLDSTLSKKDSVKLTSKKRDELLDALDIEYKAYTEQRKAKCQKFMQDSAGKLRLKILDQSNVDKFREHLLALKRGSYLRDDEIGKITEKISPREFVISLLRYDATKETKHLQKVSEDSEIDLKRMKILADFLLSSIPYENLLALQYQAYPEDRPEILYNRGNDSFQPMSKISVGQKCTAMLLMAFSDGTMPIVIDQPEDSLDIRSIWDDVCTKIRKGKETRQFIFTTHNSSLAVASDSDCYLIVDGSADQGKIVRVGSMDHGPISTDVIELLEGGDDTYTLKSKKYRKDKKDSK